MFKACISSDDDCDKAKTKIRSIISLIFQSDYIDGELQIKPSSFLREMQLTTEQRSEAMRRVSEFVTLKKPTQQFRVTPEAAIFQNFEIGATYTVQIALTNMLKIPKSLHVFMEETAQFCLLKTRGLSKIAPGLKCLIDIQFSPDNDRDYVHSIHIKSAEECFQVPIIAIGRRPLLDLPDRIVLPTTAINIQTERTMIVRNIGLTESSFVLETGHNFAIKNNRDTLKPNEIFQLTVFFLPTSLGLVTGKLKIIYETGEILHIELEGQCEEAAVRLSTQTIRFNNTYLGLSSECTVTLTNHSPYLVDYHWSCHECETCERRAKSAIKERFDDMKEYALSHSNTLTYNDIIDYEMNAEIYEHLTDEEKLLCDQSDILYHDSQFKIVPSNGQLWPNTSINFSIIFLPDKVADHKSLAYLCVNGCLQRFPLDIQGSCIGPKVALNVEEIDAQNINIGSVHNYEVTCSNLGAIPATISYLHTKTEFGGKFSCNRPHFIVKPEEVESLFIEFSSLTRGRFVERVSFEIAESGEILSFIITGNIVCPLLNFNVTDINFGDVSVGDTHTHQLYLENNTQVVIEYKINILEVNRNAKCPEFSCTSEQGSVEPYSSIPFMVTVNPLNAIEKLAELGIIMWGAKQTSRTVYMKYSAHVPQMECRTPIITIKSMFITQTYYRTIALANKSEYRGNLILQTETDETFLHIGMDVTEQFVEPFSVLEIRVSIRTDVIGDMSGKIIGIFQGDLISFTICAISVISRGPCMDNNLEDVHIGKCKTLTLIEHPFYVCNDSPIDATAIINISGPHVTASDPVICVKPEACIYTSLRIYGTTAGKFKTLVKIEVDGTEPDCVYISGEFVGGSISTQPNVIPELDIGSISTMCTYTQEVMFVNEGKVSYILGFRDVKTEIKPANIDEKPEIPFFSISENQIAINPGKSHPIQIDCFSKHPCKVRTRYVCSARKQGKKSNLISKRIFDFTLVASFEVPRVTLSTQCMEFRIDVGVDATRSVDEDEIILMNQSNVPLLMNISIDEPFHFFNNGALSFRDDIQLQPGQDLPISVKFEPELKERKILLKTGYMRIHYKYNPSSDKVQLAGIVNYPNVAFEPPFLDFHSIEVDQTMSCLVLLRNTSSLQVDYTFVVNQDDFIIRPIDFKVKSFPTLPRSQSYDSIPPIAEIEDVEEMGEVEDVENEPESVYETLATNEEAPIAEESIDEDKSIEILNSEECLTLAQTTLEQEMLSKELRTILYPLISNQDQNEQVLPIEDLLRLENVPSINPNKLLLDVVPSSGTLAPYAIQMISVRVTPPPKAEFSASLICKPNGGASSVLEIFARSGDVLYHLKSKICDMGIVYYNHIAETTFSISNVGYLSFSYALRQSTGLLCGMKEFQPIAGWLKLSPPEGIIAGQTTLDIDVQYFPGMPGYFETNVYLEIANIDPIKITIRGCATIPQYTFDFPRAINAQMNPLCYLAIADITYPKHMSCPESFTTQPEVDLDGWVYVRYKRHYPSAKDIEMAIERRIIRDHLEKNPNLIPFIFENRAALIPDLVLPSYIIDLGYVILNTMIEIHLVGSKYADTTQKLVWTRLSRKCYELGFSIAYEEGVPGPFLEFKPTHKLFPNPNTEVVSRLTAIVSHNMKIDFEIRAVITVPSLTFKGSVIDFGRIQCGFCLRKPVILYNDGVVSCSFKSVIQSTTNRSSNIFFTKCRDGTVAAGKSKVIDIYFQPQCHMKYEWRLVVAIESNKEPMKITLKGYGIVPELEIVDDHISFEPTLPYEINNIKYFKIFNKSQFPIEICFTDFDKELEKEEAIVKTILIYYNATKILIPPRHVGQQMPSVFVELYNMLIDALKNLLKGRIYAEYMNMIRKRAENQNLENETILNITDIPDPLKDKSFNEIQIIFQENVNDLKIDSIAGLNVARKGSMVKISSSEEVVIAVDSPTTTKEGVLLIFHGDPITEYIFAANKTARLLNIPVKSIDTLIIEALIRNELLASLHVNQTITNAFNDIAKPVHSKMPSHFDQFDIIKTRVDLIRTVRIKSRKSGIISKLSGTKTPKGGKSNIREGSSKSDRSKKASVEMLTEPETFLGIPVNFLYELLENSLQRYLGGIVIESLNSLFITKPKTCLVGLLRGIGNIRYIHQIYYSLNIDSYQKDKNDEMNVMDYFDKPTVLSKLLNYTSLEIASPSERKIFHQYLETRKHESQQRWHARKDRLKKSLQANRKDSSKRELKILEKDIKKTPPMSVGKFLVTVESEIMPIQNEEVASDILYICENWHKVLLDVVKPISQVKSIGRVNTKTSQMAKSIDKSSTNASNVSKAREINSPSKDKAEDRNNLGITTWFIDNNFKRNMQYSELIPELLSANPELTKALRHAQMALLNDMETTDKLYSVLTVPKDDSTKFLSNEFVIYDADGPRTDDNENLSSSSVVKRSTSSLRKSQLFTSGGTKRRRRASSRVVSLTEKYLKTRRILLPGEVGSYQVHFLPENIGSFTHCYNIQLVAMPMIYKIYLEGKADIPKIFMKPTVIFSKVLPMRDGHDIMIAYFEKEEVLHLGAIAAQSVDSRIQCLIAEDKLHLVNDSCLPCQIHIDFIDKQDNFSVYTEDIMIFSNNSNFLILRGHPVSPGKILSSMIITTQNNPEVNCVKLSSIGTNFAIQISPNEILFQRVLIDKSVEIDVELKNQSLLGAHWEIDFTEMNDFYSISDTSGYLKPLGSKTITFSFNATSYIVVPRRKLPIKFYDKHRHCTNPILEETIYLAAEVVNVAIEYNTEVFLGDIKIGQVLSKAYSIRNKSQFELKYSFVTLERENAKDSTNELRIIRNSVAMEPHEGSLKANDITNVTIKFKTHFPIEFKNVPVFKCTIFDPLVKRNVIDFAITISGKVFSSMQVYKLCPLREVIFSPQIVDTEVHKDIVLYNEGRYSFTYVITAEHVEMNNGARNGKEKNGKKAVIGTKVKKRKSKLKMKSSSTLESESKKRIIIPTSLKKGIFTISPASGIIHPKTETYIRINCLPKKTGLYKEKIIFHISGVSGKNANGEILCLQGSACFPQFDFSDLNDIFKQHMIVNIIEDALCTKQIMMNSIFVVADKQFYFNSTCLNTTKQARMKIRNSGEVGAKVLAEVSGSTAFWVEPRQQYIDSYEFKFFDVFFKPITLDKYFGIVKVSVELSKSELEVKLSGDGYLPTVKIVEPPLNEKTNQYELEFKPQFLNTTTSKSIVLFNSGMLDALVILGISGDPDQTVVMTPKVLQLYDQFCASDFETNLNHSATVRVVTEQSEDIVLSFTPTKPGRVDFEIKLFVHDNPYETLKIKCTGAGYSQDIRVDGLDPIMKADELDECSTSGICYKLDFGYKPMHCLNKAYFKFKNTSTRIYKFQIDGKSGLNFVPTVGHLKPNACKDIIVTYFSKETTSFKDVAINCKLNAIQYIQESNEELSWDDRLNYCDRYQLKAEEYSVNSEDDHLTEPDHVILPDCGDSIRFLFSISVDYCYYDTDSTTIDMPPTILFNSSKEQVTVRNPSQCPLHIKWVVDQLDSPRHSASTLTLPSQRPRSSSINPDKDFRACLPFKKPMPLTGQENFLSFDTESKIISNVSTYQMSHLFSKLNIEERYATSDEQPRPLIIEPEDTTILPLNKCTFTFTFSPYYPSNFTFTAYGVITNLRPDYNPLTIDVRAESILPLYYFKLDPSDYLVTRRGYMSVCGIAPTEGTSILEFEAIGFGIPICKSFKILNPTNESFTYRWEKALKVPNVNMFRCEDAEGSVSKGHSSDARFTFIASMSGTFEMFYTFIIDDYDISVTLLLVGHAREPCVYFENSGLTLRPTVLGIVVHETVYLKNQEDILLSFRVTPSSLYHDGRIHKIGIHPISGVLAPKSSTPISIKFHPTQIGFFTFNVEFKVDRIQNPVVLSINAICYKVEPLLKFKREFSMLDIESDKDNCVHFPALEPSHVEKCVFLLSNSGKIGFYYNWVLTDQFTEDFVNVDFEPREGYVKSGTEVECIIGIKAIKPLRKQKVLMALKVTYGPTFPVCFICTTCKQRIMISETSHNFGACLAQKQATRNNLWTLEISNTGSIAQIAQFEKSSFEHLTLEYHKSIIVPRDSIKVHFYFHPTKICSYRTVVNLILNAKTHPIVIMGQGVLMDIQLGDLTDKFIDFGPIPLGKSAKRRVNIINKSKCAVSIYFDIYDRLPIFFKTMKKLEPQFDGSQHQRPEGAARKRFALPEEVDYKSVLETKSDLGSESSGYTIKTKSDYRKTRKKSIDEDSLDVISTQSERAPVKSVLRVRPAKWIKLFPQQSTEFMITCMPSYRMPVFQEQIFCQAEDTIVPLSRVKASCVAAEYVLMKTRISFGTAIIGSANTMNTKLVNSGDLGGKFKWTWITIVPVAFSITPMEGYTTPGTCTDFAVQFQPPYIHCNFFSTARLVIENYRSSFDMDISGTCINLPSPMDTLRFSGPVREIYRQKFTVKNSTPELWQIKPVVSGKYFRVAEVIVIEPKAIYTGEVTYNPLTMTRPSKFHEGTLFLPLPEGQGVLYELIGEAQGPKTVAIIEKQISSKTYNIIALQLRNWMKTTQQFAVVNHSVHPDPEKKVLYKLTGYAIIDVPPLTEKNYKWTIYTLNEGKVNFIVKFRNELTREYIQYELKLTITKCSSLETIPLHTCARQVAEYKLKLENPLGQDTIYNLSSNSSQLHFVKELAVRSYTEVEVLILFKPLYAMPQTSVGFEAVSDTLGTFPYTFLLSASKAETEQMVKIQSPLGQKTVHYIYIENTSENPTEFSVELASTEFSVEKPVIAAALDKACIQITFEPSEIGGVHSQLVLHSPILGSYTFPLYGVGLHPKPQGPYHIKNNYQTFIPFKNPFAVEMKFQYSTSTRFFVLNVTSETVKPRMSTKINISTEKRKKQVSSGEVVVFETGKLIIKPAQEGYEGIEWILYLQSEEAV